jgi:hypothetical protein
VARFATACCGRRGGKSEAIARWLLTLETAKPKAPLLYSTTTRIEAKRILWQPLLRLNRTHGLGLEPNESTLTLRRGGVDRIYLTGCNNATEIGKMRGSGWGGIAIDEAQLFPPWLKAMVEESLTPALMDYDGSIRLTGTPAAVPIGYFYDCTRGAAWAHHAWDSFANPHVRAKQLLRDTLILRGITEGHPSIQREFYGRWSFDPTALVIAYDAVRNGYTALPQCSEKWQHVFGVDLGWDDADAIAVLGWNVEQPGLYLVEEHVLAKQTITELTARLKGLVERYKPIGIVVDTGGLGRKIVEEISGRTGLSLEAAEKTRKLEHIEMLNDALRSGRFYARTDSRFAADALMVEWDRSKPERPKISSRYHSDIVDGVLYGFRLAQHWLHKKKEPETPRGTDEWLRKQQRAMFEHVQKQVAENKRAKSEGEEAFGGEMESWGDES